MKKLISVFMIILIIVPFFPIQVSAQQEQRACCERTLDNEACQFTNANNCDTNFRSNFASCEQTSYCRLGSCFIEEEGRCFRNTPRSTCNNQNGIFFDAADCQIPQAQLGCCIIGNEASFTTQARCRLETSRFPHAQMIFEESVTNEQECIDMSRSLDRGACVREDSTCIFTTREACDVSNAINDEINETARPRVGFHKDFLCSNELLGTECARQQRTGCFEGDVYWFDSCGNPENIYNADRTASYNNGFVLEEELCTADPNDPRCGNCDYALGTLCGEAQRDIRPVFGDSICKSVDCEDVFSDTTSPNSGGSKKAGESWCLYDGAVGQGRDLVGSRHFRSSCVNSEEIIEPCRDFREEICIQGVLGQEELPTLESFSARGDFLQASCRENRFENCNACNDIEQCGGECSSLSGNALQDCCARKCCEDISNKDCTWLETGIAAVPDGTGACVPEVPPGLKFWSEEIERAESTTRGEPAEIRTDAAPRADAESTCSLGSLECTVVFQRSGIKRIFGRDFECVNNCQCTEPNWVVAGNNLCRSLGDCGAYFNILGRATLDGYSNTASAEKDFFEGRELTRADIGNFEALSFIDKEEFEEEGIWNKLKGPIIGGGIILGVKILPKLPLLGRIFPASKAVVAAKGVTTTAASGSTFGTVLSFVNIFAWSYLAYSLIDVLFAQTEEVTYKISCDPWQAPTGGNDCERCNEGNKPCSLYRCKSLGQLCSLINPGTDDERCVNINPNDVNSPIISAAPEDLSPGLTLTETRNIGFRINEEIAPFTPVAVGININEPAQCKFDLNTGIPYNNMASFFGSSSYLTHHNVTFSLPSELAEEEVLRLTGGLHTLYIKCQDASGNRNERDYFIRFGIREGPDLTAPSIEATSIANNALIAHNINETSLSIYVNEPSECKWSREDIDYDLMQNEFSCTASGLSQSSIFRGLFECNTRLTNLALGENNFFFRCKDQPTKPENERNVNTESYAFTLMKTNELIIADSAPSGRLYNGTVTLEVSTAGGSDQGNAMCAFSLEDVQFANMNEFLTTNARQHRQPLELITGMYNYNIRCTDRARNEANSLIGFEVAVDLEAPRLTYIFTDISASILHIEVNENSNCEYNTAEQFTFGDGTPMTGVNTIVHEASLTADRYFVKCRDIFENEMSSIIYP